MQQSGTHNIIVYVLVLCFLSRNQTDCFWSPTRMCLCCKLFMPISTLSPLRHCSTWSSHCPRLMSMLHFMKRVFRLLLMSLVGRPSNQASVAHFENTMQTSNHFRILCDASFMIGNCVL